MNEKEIIVIRLRVLQSLIKELYELVEDALDQVETVILTIENQERSKDGFLN